jgi:hypothetical protein
MMTHITLSDSMRAQLGSLSEPLVLCDEAGNPLGTFTPVTRLTDHQRVAMTLPNHLLESNTPAEELRRRLRDEPRITQEEIMRKAKQYL